MDQYPAYGRSGLRRSRAHEGGATWLITIRCHGREHLLPPRVRHLVVQSLLWLQRNQNVQIHGFAVMSNHVHIVVTLAADQLPVSMHSLKSFTANQINKALGRRGQLWDEGYQDRTLPTTEAVRAAIRYAEENPVTANMVTEARQYEWSSAWPEYRGIMNPLI